MPWLNGLLFAGLWTGGLRNPFAWTLAACLLWAAALWRPPDLRAVPAAKIWGAWLAWMLACALLSSEPLRSLAAFARPLSAVLLFAMLRSSWQAADGERWFLLLCLSSLGLGLAALFWRTPGFPYAGLLYPYYNYTACVEAMAFAAGLGALGAGYPSKPWEKAALLGIMAFCLGMILLVKSRGALLACALSGAVWLWRRKLHRALAWSCLAGLAALVLMPARWSAPLLKLDHRGLLREQRSAIWASSLAAAADHPLLGTGPGLFERGFARRKFAMEPNEEVPTRFGMSTAHAHSEFLQAMVETGWPGLALFLWASLSLWSSAWRRRDGGWVAEAALGAFHAVFIHAFVDNVFHLPALHWLYFSCLAAAGGGDRGQGAGSPSPRLRLACAVGLALAGSAWVPDWAVRHYEGLAFHARDAESAAWMRRALALAPGDQGLWEDLARLHLRSSPPEIAPAIEALSQASRRDPTNALYPLMRGEILASQGRWDQALALAGQALSLEPGFIEARLLAAQALCRMGERSRAARELEALRLIHGRQADGPRYRGYSGMILHFDAAEYGAVSRLVREGCRR